MNICTENSIFRRYVQRYVLSANFSSLERRECGNSSVKKSIKQQEECWRIFHLHFGLFFFWIFFENLVRLSVIFSDFLCLFSCELLHFYLYFLAKKYFFDTCFSLDISVFHFCDSAFLFRFTSTTAHRIDTDTLGVKLPLKALLFEMDWLLFVWCMDWISLMCWCNYCMV